MLSVKPLIQSFLALYGFTNKPQSPRNRTLPLIIGHPKNGRF